LYEVGVSPPFFFDEFDQGPPPNATEEEQMMFIGKRSEMRDPRRRRRGYNGVTGSSAMMTMDRRGGRRRRGVRRSRRPGTIKGERFEERIPGGKMVNDGKEQKELWLEMQRNVKKRRRKWEMNEDQGEWKMGGRRLRVDRVYWNHLISQMFFFNIYPPKDLYDFSLNATEVNGVDLALRLEHFNEGWDIIRSTYPEYFGGFRSYISGEKNKHEGRGSDHHIRYSCEVGWKIYEYFVQDFVCLGYEMPPQCLKEECRP